MFQLERYPVLPPSTTWRQLKPAHNAGRFRVCIFEVQQFPFDVSEGAKYTPPHAVEAYLNLMPRQSPHWKRYPLRACVSGGDCELFSYKRAVSLTTCHQKIYCIDKDLVPPQMAHCQQSSNRAQNASARATALPCFMG
mmetsp:Transcript_20774/g.68629  ORF Transcript_20774/g.68629 Transcript_20774/m.68629 type:complete len:138 (+) Transcript_20774:1576-1989(+)